MGSGDLHGDIEECYSLGATLWEELLLLCNLGSTLFYLMGEPQHAQEFFSCRQIPITIYCICDF